MSLFETLSQTREKIQAAATRSNRSGEQITLIAVSKGQPVSKILEVFEAGQKHFGENYAQEFLDHEKKITGIWHFIGHLQRNKVKSIVSKVHLIHSVDSLALAQEINKQAAAIGKVQPVLVEINLAQESSKTGLSPQEVLSLVQALNDLPHLDLQGFMTLSSLHFCKLREIRDEINEKKVYKHSLTELSIGMSNDFEEAIEEGSTMVRIGTGIFGNRE